MTFYRFIPCTLLLAAACLQARAQQPYRAGFARESTEPGAYPFSLTMAGYGAPPEGRFSLDWIKTGEAAAAFGNARQAVLNDTLYTLSASGSILAAPRSLPQSARETLAAPEPVISLAAYRNNLYALTERNNLLRRNVAGGENWYRIARYNGITYDIKLQAIAITGNRLYGRDSAGNIYKARHNSDGNMSASAFAIGAGKQRVVIVGLDVCGFDHAFITGVKKEISRQYHVPPQAVLVNASHTHFAPVAQLYPVWEPHCQRPDSTWLYGTVKPAIVRAAGAALRNMAPSALYFGRGKTAIGRNRCFSKAPLPYDDNVDVITAVRSSDGEKTVLFLTPCHAVFSNSGREGVTLSANFPAVTRASLEGKQGVAHSVFIQGCAGDINPADDSHVKTGEALAADIQSVLAKPMEKISGNITCYIDTISFPVKPMAPEAVLAMQQESAKHPGDMIADRNLRWANLMLQYRQKQNMPQHMPVYVQTINIGNWKLVGLSREVVTDYSTGIKALYPGKLVSVAGYCNDVSSYLPTARHMQEGTYEGVDSFFWYGQPSLFPENVYETVMDNVRQKNR